MRRVVVIIAIMLGAGAGVVRSQTPDSAHIASGDCTYTVSSPGPSTVWNVGTSSTIQWFKSGTCSDGVDLDLWRDGVRVVTIANNVSNNGVYSWAVQSYLRTALEYQVRVRDRDDLSSDGYSSEFTLLNSAYCGYRVTEPTTGDSWPIDDRVTIRWNRAGTCTSPVDLHLLYNGQQIVQIASRTTDVGSASWTVPDELAPGSGYSVRIRDSNDHNSYDVSDSFAIVEAVEACSYSITSPETGTVWNVGESADIGWSFSGACGGQIDLDLLLEGEQVKSIVDGATNTGSFSWNVPTDLEQRDGYAVRIRDEDNGSIFDVSDTFEIAGPVPQDSVYWIEAAARLAGESGSLWRTDLVIKSLSDSDADVQIRLRGSGGGTLDGVVPGKAQAAYEDVLGLMEKEGKGWLEITATQPILASARIYNLGEDGTFGQFVQGYPEGGGLGDGESGYLLQLRQSEGEYRTNLLFTNPTGEDAAVDVTLYDAEGASVASYRLDLDPRALLQDLEPFANRAGRPNLGWGFAQVDVAEGGPLLISASVVDSRTNDATTVLVKRDGE